MRYGAGSLHNSPSAAEWSGGWWCDVKCADLFVLSFRETIVAVEGADGACSHHSVCLAVCACVRQIIL